jgi:quercetin dioxygenase-like cupin family protein
MRLATTTTVLLGLTAIPAAAQNAPAAAGVERTVLAGSRLPDLGAKPIYFCAFAVTVPASAASHISTSSNEILYQLAGSTEVGIQAETKTLAAGEAMFVPAGINVSLKAGGDGPSRTLQFLLVADAAADSPVPTEPASANEVFRSPAPIPGLKPGAHEVNLTRVTFPPQMPPNPPHHRSGAAIYYILSGTGATTVNGSTAEKGPGSLIYEPSSLVHQWGNPGGDPFTFLAFNINPEGVPAVVPEAPPK